MSMPTAFRSNGSRIIEPYSYEDYEALENARRQQYMADRAHRQSEQIETHKIERAETEKDSAGLISNYYDIGLIVELNYPPHEIVNELGTIASFLNTYVGDFTEKSYLVPDPLGLPSDELHRDIVAVRLFNEAEQRRCTKEESFKIDIHNKSRVSPYLRPYYIQREDELIHKTTRHIFRIVRITHYDRATHPTKQTKFLGLKFQLQCTLGDSKGKLVSRKELEREYDLL